MEENIRPSSNIEAEFREIDSKQAWAIVFQHIRSESSNNEYTLLEAKKLENKNLNRYRDVSPYDHSRVVLSKGSCDYINANLIKMDKSHRRYILTQGPLKQTTGHFWLMVWEQNCKAVLMLNRIIEKNQVKCHQYWPEGTSPGTDDVLVLNDVGLKVEYMSQTESTSYTTRTFRLTDLDSGNSREILHFHYTTWPDFGVPQSPTEFLDFLMDVRKSGALDQNVGPPVVHCSAGIGRSGTFCLVDSCLVLIEENGINTVNVRYILLEMRKYRMGLIQTPDQLRFSYLAIIEGSKQYINPGSTVDADYHDKIINLDNLATHNDVDEPPPPLPPREASLKLVVDNDINSLDNHVMPVSNYEERPPDKPLPPLPGEPPDTQKNDSDSSEECSQDSSAPLLGNEESESPDSGSSVRHRTRVERNKRMEEQLQNMKRKQKASEDWQRFKRSLLNPVTIGIGLGLVILGGSYFAYTYFSSKS